MNDPFVFEIPGRLSGLNEIIKEANVGRYIGNRHKRQQTELCGQHIVSQRVPIFDAPIRIGFEWFEFNQRRDVDNITAGAKFILDALVETGRIPNDGRRWIKEISHLFPEPDRDNPRIKVTITKV